MRIPRRLAVEVGVDVDEAGRDQKTVGVDGSASRRVDRSDVDDDVAVDGNVRHEPRTP